MRYFGNQEWSEARGDFQYPPDMADTGPSDMAAAAQSQSDMERTPLGEPRVAFDVRCVYDSRPVNGYDFNISVVVTPVTTGTSGSWQTTFNVPNGYRIVPREWDIQYDSVANVGGKASQSIVTLQQNGANLPNNGPIIIGFGTAHPIKSFFICEENTTFGISGSFRTTSSSDVIVNVYGNLLAVTDVALPFEVTNRKV